MPLQVAGVGEKFGARWTAVGFVPAVDPHMHLQGACPGKRLGTLGTAERLLAGVTCQVLRQMT
jgi:hypothetical protein